MLNNNIFYANINNEIYQVKIELALFSFPANLYNLHFTKWAKTIQCESMIYNIAGIGRILSNNCDYIHHLDNGERIDFRMGALYATAEDAIKQNKDGICVDGKEFDMAKINSSFTERDFYDIVRKSLPKNLKFYTDTNCIGEKQTFIGGYKWDGVKPVLGHPTTKFSDGWLGINHHNCLFYDIISEELYMAEDVDQYYATEEECIKNNSIKIHCF